MTQFTDPNALAYMDDGARNWRKKYTDHKHHAKQVGVDFLLTFEEWYGIWNDSGKLNQRGIARGEYCMGRFGDIGPYAVGNVRIITVEQNHAEAEKSRKPRTQRQLLASSLAHRGKKIRNKLSKSQVLHIRNVYDPKCSKYGQRGLANEFSVDTSTIWAIVARKTWKNI